MSLITHHRDHDDESDWVSCSDSSHHDSIDSGNDEMVNKGLMSKLKSKRESWLTSFSTRRDHATDTSSIGDTDRADDANLSTPKRRGHWVRRHLLGPGEPPTPLGSPPEASHQVPETPLLPGLNRLFQNLTRQCQLLTTGTNLNSNSIVHSVAPHSIRGHDTSIAPNPIPSLPLWHDNVGGVDDEEKVATQIRFHPPPATRLNSSPSTPRARSSLAIMDFENPSRSPNLADLLTGLSSSEDATRKMAAFKLQSLTNDPSFAEHFVISGGLPLLRGLILETSGNTLAYSLASFARLLEVDQGWEAVNNKVVEKVCSSEHITLARFEC